MQLLHIKEYKSLKLIIVTVLRGKWTSKEVNRNSGNFLRSSNNVNLLICTCAHHSFQ